LVISRRWGRRGWGEGWGVVRHSALWKGRDWDTGIVGIWAGMWHIISLRRTRVRIVDESRVLVRGVRINLRNSGRTQQFNDGRVRRALLWEALSRCMGGIST
jgi:hypothetical protein